MIPDEQLFETTEALNELKVALLRFEKALRSLRPDGWTQEQLEEATLEIFTDPRAWAHWRDQNNKVAQERLAAGLPPERIG